MKKSTLIEIIILALGTLISLWGTFRAVQVSTKLAPYFVCGAVGLLFVILLIVFRKKKYTPVIGLVMIFFYLIFGGFGYIFCEVNKVRARHLEHYKQNEITLVMDGESYHWDRESVSYDYGNLKHFNLEGHDAKLYVGDSEYEHFELYQRTEQPSVLYFEVTSSGSGEYLPLYLDIPD